MKVKLTYLSVKVLRGKKVGDSQLVHSPTLL